MVNLLVYADTLVFLENTRAKIAQICKGPIVTAEKVGLCIDNKKTK